MATNDLILGSGKIYVDVYDDAGAKTGEFALGNCTGFNLSVASETVDVINYQTKERGMLAKIKTTTSVSGSIVCNFHNLDNYTVVFSGEAATLAQTSGTATAEQITASSRKGRYFSTAKRKISSVVVKHKTGSGGTLTTATVGTDYTVDADTGRVFITANSTIPNGDIVVVDYSYAALDADILRGAIKGAQTAQIRFVSDNTYGSNQEILVHKASVQADGETSFIGDDVAEFTISFTALSAPEVDAASPYFTIIRK